MTHSKLRYLKLIDSVLFHKKMTSATISITCFICYLYLFTFTCDQHDFHFTWCSCNTKCATSEAGTVYPSGAPDCNPGF